MNCTKQKPVITTSILACLAFCILLCGLCLWYLKYDEDVQDSRQMVSMQIYSIEPNDIPVAIDAPDFLKPMGMSMGPIPTKEHATPQIVAPDDFYRIARRASQEWKELPLTFVNFSTPCQYTRYGPQTMSFSFTQPGGVSADTLRASITIDVLNAWVDASTQRYREHFLSTFFDPAPKRFDWTAITVQADEVLRIVEDNGGRALRESQGCDDVVGFLELTKWEIEYRVSHKPVLTFYVDWQTGEVTKKIETLPDTVPMAGETTPPPVIATP